MGNGRTRAAALAALMLVGGLTLTGCASEATATAPLATTMPTSGDAQGSDDARPDGSDAKTPSCQDASSAVLAVVNDSLREAALTNGTVEPVLPWLSARPDTDLELWTLTGLVEDTETQQGTEGGYFVVFATDSDPTSPTFDGKISALGVATSMTTLPPLEPAYIGPTDMDDVPPAALGCGTQRAKES
jgi:hypothetical protein